MDRINKLQAFLEKQPDDSFLRHALALEYVKIGDDDAAKLNFEKLLEADPNYVGSYYHLARLYERNGNLDKAIATYTTGIEVAMAAGDNHARNELAMALDDITD